MTSSLTSTLGLVRVEERRSSLVIDVPTGASPEVWQLAKRVGATLEELFVAVAAIPRPSNDDNTGTRLDLKARSVSRDHDEVHLTHLEFELLAYFASNPSRAIGRNELLDNVWNDPAHYSPRTVDVHIRRLRRKLGPDLRLTTVRGFGYRLDGWNAAVRASTG